MSCLLHFMFIVYSYLGESGQQNYRYRYHREGWLGVENVVCMAHVGFDESFKKYYSGKTSKKSSNNGFI